MRTSPWKSARFLVETDVQGSGTVVSEGRQQCRHEVARPFLYKHFSPLVGSSKSQIGVDAVDRSFFNTFYMGLEIRFSTVMVHVANDHAQDLLDSDLPRRVDCLELVIIRCHGAAFVRVSPA
ncbi:hypothetical protein AGR1B_pAt20029 [Agrobacterium fabacearum S56]|nr:hypothetical protein AGR1B_pAt20029 [Agrobacterium fabacearum S56]